MILEEGHIEKDTVKYARPLNLDTYRDTVIRLGYIMSMHKDQMSIQDMSNLKLAQATICQLGLEQELKVLKEVMKDNGGKNEI
jgi:hypothetical protein